MPNPCGVDRRGRRSLQNKSHPGWDGSRFYLLFGEGAPEDGDQVAVTQLHGDLDGIFTIGIALECGVHVLHIRCGEV